MTPIPYEPKHMVPVILIAEDGTEYCGEYVDMRIDRKTIPEGKYAYSCRHDDSGDWVTPATIERWAWVNFAGTFVTETPIDLSDKRPFISLRECCFV